MFAFDIHIKLKKKGSCGQFSTHSLEVKIHDSWKKKKNDALICRCCCRKASFYMGKMRQQCAHPRESWPRTVVHIKAACLKEVVSHE